MNKLPLNNNYQLAWNEYGDANGIPVFYFHAMLGSHIEPGSADTVAKDLGIRLIAPDRPGYGDSEVQENFRLLDWPNVVTQLADNLNINTFSILGFSVGCNYALACAHSIPERIQAISLVGSLAPYDTDVMQNHISPDFKPLYELAITDKDAVIQQFSQMAASTDMLFDAIKASLSENDKTVFQMEPFQTLYKNSLKQSLKNGVVGCMNDTRNLALPWEFNIEDIQLPIDIWHGRDDKNVGFAIGEWMADNLPNTSFYPQSNSGHYFLFDKWSDVLASVKQRLS